MQLFDIIARNGVYIYFAFVSLMAITVTVYDKMISKRAGKMRVRESTLFLLAALGGSLSMYATMLFVRHKTKHKRFMIGIPAIMAAQAALIIFAIIKT